jgi:hypothetical protein
MIKQIAKLWDSIPNVIKDALPAEQRAKIEALIAGAK